MRTPREVIEEALTELQRREHAMFIETQRLMPTTASTIFAERTEEIEHARSWLSSLPESPEVKE